LSEYLSFLLQQEFFGKKEWLDELDVMEEAIRAGKISAFNASEELFARFKGE